MPTILSSNSPRLALSRVGLLILPVMVTMVCAMDAAETNKTAPAVVFPKSVFVHNDPAGKDPFFPNRQRGVTVVVNTNTPTPVLNAGLLKLTGIAGGAKPIATINGRTFSAGEEQDVKIPGGTAKIRVVEIKEKSVIVEIEGQPARKELVLPETILQLNKE